MKILRDHMFRRVLVSALAFVCASCAVCNTYGTNVFLNNQGLDPIHVEGIRVGMQETKYLGNLRKLSSFSGRLSRNDINLGRLVVADGGMHDDIQLFTATITMRESVYFAFEFESDDPNISVNYVRP